MISIIVLCILLCASIIMNMILIKRLFDIEDNVNDENEKLYNEIEELKKTLKSCAQTISDVVGTEVAGDDYFIRRVIGSIKDANHAMNVVQERMNSMFNIVETNDEDEDDNG